MEDIVILITDFTLENITTQGVKDTLLSLYSIHENVISQNVKGIVKLFIGFASENIASQSMGGIIILLINFISENIITQGMKDTHYYNITLTKILLPKTKNL